MKRGRKAKCPYCGHGRTIGKGIRKTVAMGARRLRVCKGCHRKFTVGRKHPVPARSAAMQIASQKPNEPQAMTVAP